MANNVTELVTDSLALAAEHEDISDRIYERFYASAPETEPLMAHIDYLVRGKMVAEVFRLLMTDDLAGEAGYLQFETRTHADSYSVQPVMYEQLLTAVFETVKELSDGQWRQEWDDAWQAKIAGLMTAIHRAEASEPA